MSAPASSFATDPRSAYLVEAYISAHQYLSKYTALAPKWIWLALPVLISTVGQHIMGWLHSGNEEGQQRQRDAAARTAAAAAQRPKPKSQ